MHILRELFGALFVLSKRNILNLYLLLELLDLILKLLREIRVLRLEIRSERASIRSSVDVLREFDLRFERLVGFLESGVF